MTRDELIAYDRWLTTRKWGSRKIMSPEKAADLYLSEVPPSSATAEEILDKWYAIMGKDREASNEPFEETPYYLRAMHEFAALLEQHKEMTLREELIRFKLWYNASDPHDHILTREIDEYLKNVKR